MKKFLFLLLIPFTLAGQQLEVAPPQSANVSPQRLNLVDELLSSSVDKGWLAGGVFLIARKGKIIYHKSIGSKDGQSAYQIDDIFRIASMTKAVTAVGIMQLFEQGKVGLDDPLHWYLPEYKEMVILDAFEESDSSFTTKPAEKAITIRHLLTHTSGITYGDFNPGKIAAVYNHFDMLGVGLSHEEWTTAEFIQRLAKVPLVFEPGEKYLYGLNMDVLGRVIEVVSDQSLSQYFQKNIFERLGMTDTHFYLPKNKHQRLVPLYTTAEDQTLVLSQEEGSANGLDYPKAKDKGHYAGGGGLSSTTLDYAKFIQALLNDGRYNRQQLLAAHTIDLIKADQLVALNREGKGISQTPGISFGLGFMVWLDEAEGITVKSPGTYEWAGLFNTKYFIDPAEDLIFVGMTQVLPFTQEHFWEKLYTVIYGSLDD